MHLTDQSVSQSVQEPVGVPLEPVPGDLLPAVGSTVLIHLASLDQWVEHTVAGYYVWGDLGGNPSLHRVFVRVRDKHGLPNARLLKDVRLAPAKPEDDRLKRTVATTRKGNVHHH